MASSYGGTKQKCQACEKTVYWVEELTADNRVYHKSCFRCHHCKGTLKLGNYSSYDGVLYCKPHFDQLFKMTGRLDKSFEGTPKIVNRSTEQVQTSSRFSSFFAGTQDKCLACKKTVYPIEKVAVDGKSYHKACFRCARGGCVITALNYVTHENRIYCKHHHSQLFKEKGNFSKLDSHEPTPKLSNNHEPSNKLENNHEPSAKPDNNHEQPTKLDCNHEQPTELDNDNEQVKEEIPVMENGNGTA